MVDLVVLGRLLGVTSKKKVVNFVQEKSAPPDKTLATPMARISQALYDGLWGHNPQ